MMEGLLAALESPFALIALGLIAFFDAVVGTNVIVTGEVAFLAAGAGFAADGSMLPVVLVLSAAWLGDMTSFQIGRVYGPRLLLQFLNRALRRRLWRRAKHALQTRGAWFVVIARLLGPVSWVTPFLAGSLGMSHHVFAPASIIGVVIGGGLFVLYGAIGLQVLEVIWTFIGDHVAAIALGLTMALASVLVWRQSKSPAWCRMLKAGAMSVAIFLGTNFAYFFLLDTHAATAAPHRETSDLCDALSGPFLVSAGDTPLHLPQPINVILLSGGKAADMMRTLGWHQNLTFTHDDISFVAYLKSLVQATPPVSELYLDGRAADSAFQLPGTLKTREHIRWWYRGAGVHFGAISRDDEIAVKYYGHLPVILHDIDTDVDASRHMLAQQVSAIAKYDVLGAVPLGTTLHEGTVADYETDGGVLVLAESGYSHFAEVAACPTFLDFSLSS